MKSQASLRICVVSQSVHCSRNLERSNLSKNWLDKVIFYGYFHTQRLCVKFIVCLKMSEDEQTTDSPINKSKSYVLLDFSLTVKAAPHECVIRTGQQP